MRNIQKPGFLLKGLVGLSMCSTMFSNIAAQKNSTQPRKQMNVLFIAVDDLRPLLGCYGDPNVKSPNIDCIMKQGLAFTRAYCQMAWCSPSRSSLMTGMRPDETKVWDLVTHFRVALPYAVTLPEQFKKYGYHTLAFSKIYHCTATYGKKLDDPQSWSEPSWFPKKPAYLTPEGQELVKKNHRGEYSGSPYEAPDVPDNALNDGQTADTVIEALRRIKDQPFFLAAGFLKPHLPFVAPKKYWDLYDREQFKLADNPYLPDGAPKYAIGVGAGDGEEIRSYLIKWPLSDDEARTLIHGYNACVSYIDAQIGRIIDELEKLKLRDNTIIIIFGDNGWHLGEHGHWAKNTNFEVATRVPLIISVPGQSLTGKLSNALVELVDIYPTLCDLCSIPIPDGLEGCSFKPLLKNPNKVWKNAAFSQHPRTIPGYGNGMGYSMRTDRYRLTEWTVSGTSLCEYELYDHKTDPKENRNLAKLPVYCDFVKQLAAQLHAGWKDALPKGK
jgi:arylsulfatase A-like enzyme